MRIGELAVAAGASTKTLRFYEKSGLLPRTERTARSYGAALTDVGPRGPRQPFLRLEPWARSAR